jgi:eukaryotic-like serine/threonine-protein kinase
LPAREYCQAAAGTGHGDIATGGGGNYLYLPAAHGTTAGPMLPAAWVAAARAAPGDTTVDALARAFGSAAIAYPPGGPGGSAYPTSTLDGVAGKNLAGRIVVLGSQKAGGSRDDLTAADVSLATVTATALSGTFVTRPGWAVAAEAFLTLVLGAGFALTVGRLRLQLSATLVGATMASLLVLQAIMAMTGTALHLGGTVAFIGMVAAPIAFVPGVWSTLSRNRITASATGSKLGQQALSPATELDLAFSVLRQQPADDDTKQRLYALGMEHGRRRDYARAERVFRHLSSVDPHYRDVAAKLDRLSGARLSALPQDRALASSPGRPRAAAAESLGDPDRPSSSAHGALGRYTLERVLGRGAMATVYLGLDPNINRRVAIKTVALSDEFDADGLATARTLFRREAESSGRLNHPNIIAIYDAGEDGRTAYLAMEYFEGEALNQYTRQDCLLSPRKAIDLMARAAEALHYAHGQNVVHRDVKPANLMYNPARDELKITDFGIARLTDSNRTRTGIILGTPSYMSPEQLSASRVSGASDIYSLGVTLYHLLTGHPPFKADSIPKLMKKIATDTHRPASEYRDDLPPGIDELLDRAMAKDPAHRFPDGRAMAHALRQCLAGHSTETA